MSLKTLKQHHHVTYYSQDRDGVFKVNTKHGVVEFQPHESGLPYLNFREQAEAGMALITTICDNFEGYTKKQISKHNDSRQW